MKASIYLDHAATTPLDAQAREAMLPYLENEYGNPSSLHSWGRRARLAIDEARETLAASLGTDPAQIIFSGSGTEADNLAILGIALAAPSHKRHVIVSSIEHHGVLHAAALLPRLGFEVTALPVDQWGQVEIESVREAIREDTLLVSVMHANNEIGTLQPVQEIFAVCRARGTLFHTDAVQTFGILPVNVDDLGADLLSVSAHKLYGPKGVGALYVRGGVKLQPLALGGGQEREKRAGTENVAGIVGFAEAVRISEKNREKTAAHLTQLRDYFIQKALALIPDTVLSGHPTNRLPNNVHLRFKGAAADTLLIGLDRHGIAASSGAACSSGSIEPSHVLLALGLSESEAQTGVRFSLGRSNTQEEIDAAINVIAELAAAQRALHANRRKPALETADKRANAFVE